MKVDQKLIEVVDALVPDGYPECRGDAQKVLDALKSLTGGRKVRYKGKITEYDYRRSEFIIVWSHTITRTDSGLFIDINQPKGKRIFQSGSEYCNNSMNRIEGYR